MCFVITYVANSLQSFKNEEFLKNEKQRKTEDFKYKFRLFDDDGYLYFEGFSKIKWTFEPLDAFGITCGCTEICYLEDQRYVRL